MVPRASKKRGSKNFSLHQNHLEGLLKQTAEHHSRASDFTRSSVGPENLHF